VYCNKSLYNDFSQEENLYHITFRFYSFRNTAEDVKPDILYIGEQTTEIPEAENSGPGLSLPPELIAKLHGCAVCQKYFSSPWKLNRHSRMHWEKEKAFRCIGCFQAYTSLESLKEHLESHLQSLENPCGFAECLELFATIETLTEHLKSHVNREGKSLSCAGCLNSFATLENLRGYLQSHVDSVEKPFSCGDCWASFATLENLKKHLMSHVEIVEKPFRCADCRKSFASRENLKRHQRLHSGEKPYVCSLCNKSFPRHESLKLHVVRQTRENSC